MLAIFVADITIATSVWGAAPVPSIRRPARMILRAVPTAMVLLRYARSVSRRPQGSMLLGACRREPAELLEDAGLVALDPLLDYLAVLHSEEGLRPPTHRLSGCVERPIARWDDGVEGDVVAQAHGHQIALGDDVLQVRNHARLAAAGRLERREDD